MDYLLFIFKYQSLLDVILRENIFLLQVFSLIFILVKCLVYLIKIICLGGSKGIGKAIAVEALKHGCICVTIVARNLNSLIKAAEDLTKHCSQEQFVQYFQLDVSEDYKQVNQI